LTPYYLITEDWLVMYTPLNKGIKSKRTEKNTVALVGFSQTTRDEIPWDDKDTEIWSLNEAAVQTWMRRFDRWFQLHPEENFNRPNNPNDPNHPKWLREAKGFPIYMQKQYDYIPASVALPLGEITKAYGSYLTSSLAFMLTTAMLEGFERIELYGFELGTKTEYHYQKANAEYLIGLARGLGFEIYLPEGCSLCKGKMYGFETLDVIYRQKLEYRKDAIKVALEEKRDKAKLEEGAFLMVEKFKDLNPGNKEVLELHENQRKITRMALAEANFTIGAFKEVQKAITLYDDHLETTGSFPKQDYTKTKKVEDDETD